MTNKEDNITSDADLQSVSLPEQSVPMPEQSYDGGGEGGKPEQTTRLHGMYTDWFLEYASYVILERAVPHIYDGLKPVQRRILHSMRQLDDGRYNKVANIVGHTMQYHPHGDASIGDALVQLGQKDLLIDTQGNWGNILTGDSAAAPRYIEARLSNFALEVVFNPKTTFWKPSYDGRNKEPITLPVKFPLLLAQGGEGIAVGLATKILPHNFIEIIDACIATLENKPFILYPDFPTAGLADFTKYNDGLRGGKIKIRARIEKIDKKSLVIKEVAFGQTTTSTIRSILAANDKGKIKIKKIEDNTASEVEILIQLAAGVSTDKTIDALYAFTKCEDSISPNACLIEEDRPRFIGVTEILKSSVYSTLELLKQELLIKKNELEEQWQALSLEKWFIEKQIYKEKQYENSQSTEEAISFINAKLLEQKLNMIREVTNDDLLKLLEIRMKRILKFNIEKAENILQEIIDEIQKVENNLNNIVNYAINYYKNIKEKYKEGKERKTEIRNFDTIVTAEVAVANEKLYVNYKEGFAGYGLKKEEYVCDCSDIDDVIVFKKDGTYTISKVSEKAFFGKDIIHIDVFKKNDKRTIYNVVYRDGKTAISYIKRFAVTGVTRDKEYNITKGVQGSKIIYFTSNPNGEAEVIKIALKPKPKLRKLIFEVDFKDFAIKGRDAQGNILSRNDIFKITLKEEGVSTLGGLKVWFDEEIYRLNSDQRGKYIGEFLGEDKILVINKDGICRITNFDLSNHYEDNIIIIEKFNKNKVFSAIHYDAEHQYFYLKRFQVDENLKSLCFISEFKGSYLVDISDDMHPQVKMDFDPKHNKSESELIDVEEFIAIKGIKARGNRLTTLDISTVSFDTPLQKEIVINEENEDIDQVVESDDQNADIQHDNPSSSKVVDKDKNSNNDAQQMTLF